MIKRKVNIEISDNQIVIKNISKYPLENCMLNITNMLYGSVLFEKFDLQINETKSFGIKTDNFYEEWKDDKLHVRFYSNHKKIKIFNIYI